MPGLPTLRTHCGNVSHTFSSLQMGMNDQGHFSTKTLGGNYMLKLFWENFVVVCCFYSPFYSDRFFQFMQIICSLFVV